MTDERPPDPPAGRPRIPDSIGPYRVLDVIGEGGMGIVYAAEQAEPVRRRVAIKMMRAGFESPEVQSRFEAERRALALMDHPGIARVIDAGTTGDGRPYVVMEYVSGIRIDEYCDRFRLTLEERIDLMCALAEAVQHAHQKGVIHRDLKPSNVLVTEVDGKPLPKVIDFGIAKPTGVRLATAGDLTSPGQAIGTLAYMSPEQADGSGLDVDTRTDVYALGVLLYQLLTGSVPIDPRTVGGPRFLAQLIEPDAAFPEPSSRLGDDAETRARVAKSRGLSEAELAKRLSGDLRWIVMRAIEKDRNRRYETANGFRLDLVRYRTNEPVSARPPSAAYRFGKLVRRNRAATIAAGVAALALIGGVVSTSVGLARARAAEAEARAALVRAATEAESARAVSDFLIDLFDASRPGEVAGELTAQELLRRGAERVDAELADQPLIQARLLTTIGAVYRSLGLRGEAGAQLGRAVALYESRGVVDGADLILALREYGQVLSSQRDFARADSVLQRAVALARAANSESPAATGTDHTLAHSLGVQGGAFLRAGRVDDAERALTEALELEERELDRPHRETGTIVSDLGAVAWSRGEWLRASQFFRRAVDMRTASMGANHPDVAGSWLNLGAALYFQDRFDEALEAYWRADDVFTATLPENHPSRGASRHNIAEAHWAKGEFEAAERFFLEATRIKDAAYDPDEYDRVSTLVGLANVYRDTGRHDEAEPLYARAVQIIEVNYDADSPRLVGPLRDWAASARAAGRADRAETLEARARALSG